MLTRFTVGNFCSFDKNQTLSLIAGSIQKHKERLYIAKDMKLLKFGALFGANAAGKSNFINAMDFAAGITIIGTDIIRKDLYFKLNPVNKDEPSYFEFEICLNGKIYAYGFEIIISKKQITEEWLIELGAARNTEIFTRNTLTGNLTVNESLLDEPYNERMNVYVEDFKSVQDKTFLSFIIDNKKELYNKNPKLTILKDTYLWIRHINISYPNTPITGYDCFSYSDMNKILTVIKYFKTGITEVRKKEISKEQALEKTNTDFRKDVEDTISRRCKIDCKNAPDNCDNCGFRMNSNGRLIFVTFKNKEPIFTEITFIHDNVSNVEFSLGEESEGTQRLLDLISVLLTQSPNSVFVIDEIDRSLHPQLTVKFIQLFLELAEKNNIQLIISTHESHLLNLDILRQDEIFMVEKNSAGASSLYPFDRFKERFDVAIENRYFDGRYGGVPVFESVFPFSELEKDSDK
jgi:AAA15 family ATPase/GTPase